MNFLQQYQTEIADLCRKYKVEELYAFGSVLDEKRFTNESDVDLIVKFNSTVDIIDYADLFFGIADDLEVLLKRKIDIMILKPIRNPYLRQSIENSKQLIYAAA